MTRLSQCGLPPAFMQLAVTIVYREKTGRHDVPRHAARRTTVRYVVKNFMLESCGNDGGMELSCIFSTRSCSHQTVTSNTYRANSSHNCPLLRVRNLVIIGLCCRTLKPEFKLSTRLVQIKYLQCFQCHLRVLTSNAVGNLEHDTSSGRKYILSNQHLASQNLTHFSTHPMPPRTSPSRKVPIKVASSWSNKTCKKGITTSTTTSQAVAIRRVTRPPCSNSPNAVPAMCQEYDQWTSAKRLGASQ